MNRALLVSERQPVTFAAADRDTASAPPLLAKGVCDTARVDVENWHSVRYWSETLGVSDTQLLRATRLVGCLVVRIERHFVDKRADRQRKRENV
jgi:hypothetical protein